ncbi:MAG TPA: flagellar basal body rod protein FlgB [Vulgatibacter sp.]|nr:flagellar basal body rod protein FlgB [Vulgatibacter sp.]
MRFLDTTIANLKSALDLRLFRQNLLAGNVANADTPGYRPVDVDFDEAMASAVATARIRSPGGGLPLSARAESFIIPAAETTPDLDGNAVDLDRSLVALSENALHYGASARATSKKLAILRYVASDGTTS